jgi:hypothetical protein
MVIPALWSQQSSLPYKEFSEIPLPKDLKECSGLCVTYHGIWSINDSGNEPYLYLLNKDTTGKELWKTVRYQLPVKNVDWEAVETDQRFIYIGDFGNNKGNRKDLYIYQIDLEELIQKSIPTTTKNVKQYKGKVEVIPFAYADQTNYDKRRLHRFDCEAMIIRGDSIRLFTKNWNNGKTNIYDFKVSKEFQRIYPNKEIKTGFLITDACIWKNQTIWCGYNLKGNQYLSKWDHQSKNVKKYKINLKPAQVEGIAIWKNDVVVCTEKRHSQRASILLFKP